MSRALRYSSRRRAPEPLEEQADTTQQREPAGRVERVAQLDAPVRSAERALLGASQERCRVQWELPELAAMGDTLRAVWAEEPGDKASTWPHDPGRLGHRQLGIGHDLEHGVRNRETEGVVTQRKRERVGGHERYATVTSS